MKTVLHTLTLVLGLFFALSAHALVDGAELTSTRFFNLTNDQYVYGYTADGRIDMAGEFCRIEVAFLGPSETYAINPGMKFKVEVKNLVQFNLNEMPLVVRPLVTVTCYEIASGGPQYIALAALTPERLKTILGFE